MAFFKGKVVTAGGKGNGNTKTDIHTFTPSEGWIKAADLPWSRFSSDALVLDEGTTQVRQESNGKQESIMKELCVIQEVLLIHGGKNGGGTQTDKIFAFDGTTVV